LLIDISQWLRAFSKSVLQMLLIKRLLAWCQFSWSRTSSSEI